MSSTDDWYNKIEQQCMENIALAHFTAGSIAEKLHKDTKDVEQAIYQACASTSTQPVNALLLISEFLVSLHGREIEQQQEEEGK